LWGGLSYIRAKGWPRKLVTSLTTTKRVPLAERAPCLPMGLVTIGKTSLLFMTMIPGDTLEPQWPTLDAESKVNIQRSLNEAILVLRGI